eukprot:10425455-Lingulodinium_polyedra.AAC.1
MGQDGRAQPCWRPPRTTQTTTAKAGATMTLPAARDEEADGNGVRCANQHRGPQRKQPSAGPTHGPAISRIRNQ